jgi:SAM-dependent methyltransferase
VGKQSQVFRASEADAWLDRNVTKLPPPNDPVMDALVIADRKVARVLEVGCSNGWRLDAIHKKYRNTCFGIDPVIRDTVRRNGVTLMCGTADELNFDAGYFSVVIFGFCLYLCDPEDYFRIVMESDRVLKDGGHIILYDFVSNDPHCRAYKHHEGIFSYKLDWPQLWLGHPAYSLEYDRVYDNGTVDAKICAVLRKNLKRSFVVRK